jgi:hypothetical protein
MTMELRVSREEVLTSPNASSTAFLVLVSNTIQFALLSHQQLEVGLISSEDCAPSPGYCSMYSLADILLLPRELVS